MISMSPELGIDEPDAASFFIQNQRVLNKVLEQNYEWFWFTVQHLQPTKVKFNFIQVVSDY